MRRGRIEEVLRKRWSGLALVVEEVKNPHNISAILRTADAAGVQNIFIVDPLGEGLAVNETISTGAEKWLTIRTYYSAKLCFNDLRDMGYRIAATALRDDAVSIYDYDFTRRVAIVLGNEKNGVRSSTIKMSDDIIKIPMRGMVQSLNVSVSAGIILFEAIRQRTASGVEDPLSEEEIKNLIERLK
ncbi:MAG: RNA methyltransferase [Candidatus Aminicenantes bacterium]|nr:RNA methyltransferase [Candidatus Aminicenantes bacterium]